MAKGMCHDPETAERFYVLLPDKKTGVKRRKLRLQALKMAADESDDESSTTSSDGEELVYDDESDPDSLSSDELRRLDERRQSCQPDIVRDNVRESSGEEEEESPRLRSRKRLVFSHQYEKDGEDSPKKKMKIHTPSKCAVLVQKLKKTHCRLSSSKGC